MQAAVRNDRVNAATTRPWLIRACQELDGWTGAPSGSDQAGGRHPAKPYQPLWMRCSACGYGIGFVAIAPLATGVIVVWGRHKVLPKERQGGWRDFARLPGNASRLGYG